MPLVGLEPTISAGERPQTYALDRAATGTCIITIYNSYIFYVIFTVNTLYFVRKRESIWNFCNEKCLSSKE